MPRVRPRVLSRGEVQELQRLQAATAQRGRRPTGSARMPDFYRPLRLDGPK